MPRKESEIIALLERVGFPSEKIKHTPNYERAHLIEEAIKNEKLTEKDLISFCKDQGIRYLKKEDLKKLDIQIYTQKIPANFAWENQVFLIAEEDSYFLVLSSLANLFNQHLEDDLKLILEKEVQIAFSLPQGVKEKLEKFYKKKSLPVETQTNIDSSQKEKDDAPIIQLVNEMIKSAVEMRASDIHIEPQGNKIWIRYRIDGHLKKTAEHPINLLGAIVSRIKIMSKSMSMAEKRLPQDGRIQLEINKQEIDLRISSVPSIAGESIVIRILQKGSQSLSIEKAGFSNKDLETMKRLISMPDGIILITGPTGSGKTTTLYSFLNHINKPDKKIITVEDPVEYELSGINQVMVRNNIGMTFALALRAILRQAPNIIMIGEIRGINTSTIAMNAALTGHLVLSTLHTNDAPSAVPRLMNMGIQPFLIASSVRAIVAQRLVRKLCSHCKQPSKLSKNMIKLLKLENNEETIYEAKGCEKCRFTGYEGRIGIFEIFLINDVLKHMINQGATSLKLKQKAQDFGMLTLREDGIKKILQGITSVEEVLSLT